MQLILANFSFTEYPKFMRSLRVLIFTISALFLCHTIGLSNKPLSLAPDFTLTDLNGEQVSLSDFKGKVIYLDIWASWCPPCIYEINKAKSVKKYFKDQVDTAMVFLYVSIDKDEKSWKNMVKKKNIQGVHLISKGGEEEAILQKYNVLGVPKFILIDKEGNIVDGNAKAPSDPDLINDIEKLLAQ